MAKTAKAVMTVALSFLGVKEYPANSNKVKFNTDYYGSAVSGADYPWCVTYVWDCFRLAGASSLFYNGKKTAYCPAVATWARNNKLTVSLSDGRYGDLVLFDWGKDGKADHIGFIERKNSDGSYTTIEGNTSYSNDSNGGEVMRRTRYTSQMQMIIRPKYDAEEDDMTEEQVIKIVKNVLAGYDTEPDDWAKKANIIERAKHAGITVNGERPQGYSKREETMAMCLGILDRLSEEQEMTIRAAVADALKDMEDDGK